MTIFGPGGQGTNNGTPTSVDPNDLFGSGGQGINTPETATPVDPNSDLFGPGGNGINGLPNGTPNDGGKGLGTDIGSPGVQFDPLNPPPMKTLVYSPDVQILIARGNKQYDVSKDIVAFSVRRVENSVSTLMFRLANKKDGNRLRYNQTFERMDRVVCILKRTNWVQVFSGYLDSVPHRQLYPGTVNFRASCTLKRLLHTWWDPGLPLAQGLFNQAGARTLEPVNGEALGDVGLGSLLRQLLIEVGKWPSTNVHIQAFPIGYYLFMEQQLRKYNGVEKDVQEFRKLLLGSGDTSGGRGAAAGRQLGVTRGGYIEGIAARQLEVIRAVDDMGMGPNSYNTATAQALNTGAMGGSGTGGDNQPDPDVQNWEHLTEAGSNQETAAKNDDAAIICFMTIHAESNWIMYANASVPDSLSFPHEALSTDHTSVGLYQQQNNGAWGSTAQRMNPRESTGMFLQALNRLDWRNMNKGAACQAVQNSAFPQRYAQFEQIATEEVRAIRGNIIPNTPVSPTTGNLTSGVQLPMIGGVAGAALPNLSIPSLPNQNGVPSVAGAGAAVGGPLYDLAGAVAYATAQIGKPYHWGAVGPASFDCWSEDTQILTRRGEVSLVDVTTNDEVLTRQGWRRVLRAWKVRDAEVITVSIGGRNLTGTSDHRVWTENRGWTALGDLTEQDVFVVCGDVEDVKPATGVELGFEHLGSEEAIIPVYDLMIEGVHEFFANNVLAHNCSGLTWAAYRSIGMEIGRDTYAQARSGQRIAASQLQPGDLIQPNSDHVVMYAGPGMIIQAPTEGQFVLMCPIYFDMSSAICYHYPPAEFGANPSFNPLPQAGLPGVQPGTVAQGPGGTTVQVGPGEDVARNLFSYLFEPGRFSSSISMLYGSQPGEQEKAFINDEPLIQMVTAMAKAGLRNFASAPNGDFIAYYPDYFGLDGKRAVLTLEDIELKNVQIDLNDDAMATHVYVAGSSNPRGGSFGVQGWLKSKGVATVENNWLFQRLTMAAPKVPGETVLTGMQVMQKFGMRPLVTELAQIQSGPMEFLQAMHIFMTKWAEQYATQVEMTFMPELYPGMRVKLEDHSLQVYVTEVIHSGDWENGFTTKATIMAPSDPTLGQAVNNIATTAADFLSSAIDIIGGTKRAQW